jgi:hypothetical protein
MKEKLKSVAAHVRYVVLIDCPYCEGKLDLTQNPYSKAYIFKSIFELLRISRLGLEYECNHCKKQFVLDELLF